MSFGQPSQSQESEETSQPDLTLEQRERERAWVRERFEQLGFEEVSEALAEWRVDWHDAERLLSKGATHAQVLKLLWPLP